MIVGKRVTVTDAPTLLTSPISGSDPALGSSMLLRNRGASSVFLGAADVSTSTGYELQADQATSVDLYRGEALYAIVTTGTVLLHILEVGV